MVDIKLYIKWQNLCYVKQVGKILLCDKKLWGRGGREGWLVKWFLFRLVFQGGILTLGFPGISLASTLPFLFFWKLFLNKFGSFMFTPLFGNFFLFEKTQEFVLQILKHVVILVILVYHRFYLLYTFDWKEPFQKKLFILSVVRMSKSYH